MRKATSQKEKAEKAQPAPAKLGTKRSCTKCATKFYDFGKEEINCPKCKTKLKVEDLSKSVPPPAEPKKSKAIEKVAPEALMQSDDLPESGPADDTFESVEDLADEEEDLDLDVDDEDEGSY